MPILANSTPTQMVEKRNVSYEDYVVWQNEQVQKRKRNQTSDLVAIMTFSNSLYTTTDDESDLDLSDTVLKTNRGGGDTWHGPGQVLVSPVVRLADDVRYRDYLNLLEDPVRRVLFEYGVTPDERLDDDLPGIQVQGRKIAQVGTFLNGKVTSYGLAFNVTCDLTKFAAINLCGVENCPGTNLEQESSLPVDLEEVFSLVKLRVEKRFTTKPGWLSWTF